MPLAKPLAVVAIAAFVVSGCSEPPDAKRFPPIIPAGPKTPAPKTAADLEWDAVQTCHFAILSTLHDPKSAEFPDGVSRAYRKLANGVYTVQIVVRARNAFNALRLNTVECKIDAKTMQLKSVKQLGN